MSKLKRKEMSNLWEMRNLSLKEFFENVSNHPDLKFLLTAAGIWWLIRFALVITIAGNVIYYVIRIFNLVLA